MTERGISPEQSGVREKASQQEPQRKSLNWMTQETHDRLVREQEQARRTLVETVDYIRDGRIHGSDDYRDQAAFDRIKDDMNRATVNFQKLDSILSSHRIISPRLQTDKVKRGNSVVVEIEVEGEIEPSIVTILGQYDAGTRMGWTHPGTPFGAAILEKKAGERFNFMVGKSQRSAVVKEILPGQFEGPRESLQKPQSS